MGRTEKSQGLAPQATRKSTRAKQARQIINKTIPALLASNSRAKQGVESSKVIDDPQSLGSRSTTSTSQGSNESNSQFVKREGQGSRKRKHGRYESQESDVEDSPAIAVKDESDTGSLGNPRPAICIRILNSDTLTVAATLSTKTTNRKVANVCVLNMASPLRPGGGVLAGATSQEESLCARTTLLPSLKESFYRLPDLGGVLTNDVLVFRSAQALGESSGELRPEERYWIDVISSAALRFPELEDGADNTKRLNQKDRLLMEAKMRAVLRIAAGNKSKKLVLGAWGCGAYGNPIPDIASLWRKVLVQDTNGQDSETWEPIEEVVFAITNRKTAEAFAEALDIAVESVPASDGTDEDDNGEGDDAEKLELLAKIEGLEQQHATARFRDLKARLGTILNELRNELGMKWPQEHGTQDEDDHDD